MGHAGRQENVTERKNLKNTTWQDKLFKLKLKFPNVKEPVKKSQSNEVELWTTTT